MKIKINRKVLSDAILDVLQFIPQKPVIRMHSFIKLTVKGNRMKVEANNDKSSMWKYIDVIESDSDGVFLLSGSDISKIISKIKDDEVILDADDTSVTLRYGKGTASYAMPNPEEYISLEVPESESTTVNIPAWLIGESVALAKNFVSAETLRPVMCTINAEIKDNVFSFSASDTRILILGKWDLLDDAPDAHWYIEKCAFEALVKECKKAQDSVTMRISPKSVQYRIGNTVIQTLMTQGFFPNVERVIPQNSVIDCLIDNADISDAINRIALFCDNNNAIKFNFGRMDVMLSADNLDKQSKACENVIHNGCGAEVKIGLDYSNILKCLKTFDSGDVHLHITDSVHPVKIMQDSKPNIQCICMPMALSE